MRSIDADPRLSSPMRAKSEAITVMMGFDAPETLSNRLRWRPTAFGWAVAEAFHTPRLLLAQGTGRTGPTLPSLDRLAASETIPRP